MPSHCFAAIQRRIAYGVVLKTLSVQGSKLVLPIVLTVGVLLRFNRRTQGFVKGKCVCCFASNVAGVVVLVSYCTEVYIALAYKSVKSVIEVSRCKFTVCIVILYLSPRELPIIVLKMKFDNQKMRKAARDLSDDRQKNIEIISHCESFLAP